jgi:hypothetical protein
MIFKDFSDHAEFKLCVKLCGYRSENYRSHGGRLKNALVAEVLSDIASFCDFYNFEILP